METYEIKGDPERRVGTVVCGKWTLQEVVGTGGMASVYRARHMIGRTDAIKVLRRSYARDAGIAKRFVLEAHAVNAFDHPGVVEIRDVDVTEDGCPLLVMELLEGESLAARVQRELRHDEALRIVDELLDVLAAAHERGVVHRDIKPANVFLLSCGRVKVLDFGVARMKDTLRLNVHTQLGDRLGTVGYMPPEQLHGCHIDERVDVFSSGALMFKLFGGGPVHQADSEAELCVKMGTLPARPLAQVAPHTPEPICQVVDRALAYDRARRYQSAKVMQRDVQALRRGEPPPHARDRLAAGCDPHAKPPQRPPSLAARQPWDGDLAIPGVEGVVAPEDGSPTKATRAPDACPHFLRDALAAWRARAVPRTANCLYTSNAAVDHEMRFIGRVIDRRFRIERLIGRGGMGAVYEAVTTDGQRCALKIMLDGDPRSRPHLVERFRREALAVSEIPSDHVVQVLDAGCCDDTSMPFIAMELYAGIDLHQLIARVGAVESCVTARLFLQACRGLSAAHECGIIHRDVKPANMLLCSEKGGIGSHVTVRICDFGVAKNTLGQPPATLTDDGLLGTLLYAAPEQIIDAEAVDQRTDVWSLCIALYETLLGRQPWAHCWTQGQLAIAICSKDIPRLETLAPWVDARLAEVVHNGLRRNVAERYPSIAALASALRPFALGSGDVDWSMLNSAAAEQR